MAHELPRLNWVDQVCDVCVAGKHHHTPFFEQAHRRTTNAIKLVHDNICWPVTPPRPSDNYFLLLFDDMSCFTWLMLLPNKDDMVAAIKNLHVSVEVETRRKLKTLHTDREGEFTSVEFGRYCAERGVQR
jgi:hypothetical protein